MIHFFVLFRSYYILFIVETFYLFNYFLTESRFHFGFHYSFHFGSKKK